MLHVYKCALLQFVPYSSLVLRLLPRKMEKEPGKFNHISHDVACVVLCVVLIIELLPTQSGSKHCPAVKF